ncbi:unnamed protein product [Didymodactylos carnosus]|nr:unnamed protein product [Didymodactylos carnosus]CAF4027538.1 unnamed protein product [Didymodactylos carnosus]
MTRIMAKLGANNDTEISNKFHSEVPAISIDGHLTYHFFMTINNLIHLNCVHLLFYYSVFWISASNYGFLHDEDEFDVDDMNQYEFYERSQTRTSIRLDMINPYLYFTLFFISTIDLLSTFLLTIRKKLFCFFDDEHHFQLRKRISLLILIVNISLYISLFIWIFYLTFVSHNLSNTLFFIICIHFIFLNFLEKPQLICFDDFKTLFSRKQSTIVEKSRSLSSSTSSSSTTRSKRLKPTATITRQTPTLTRWTCLTEERLVGHDCSSIYQTIRHEADHFYTILIQRLTIKIYRSLSTLFLYDLVPFIYKSQRLRNVDLKSYILLIVILFLITITIHFTFLFPVKLQTTLHRIASHLGQWRKQNQTTKNSLGNWLEECNSYQRGTIISHKNNFYMAMDMNNAAQPDLLSHKIIVKLFGDPLRFMNISLFLACSTVIFEYYWCIRGNHWEQIMIGVLLVLSCCYPIFKIFRDRLILEFVYGDGELLKSITSMSTPDK